MAVSMISRRINSKLSTNWLSRKIAFSFTFAKSHTTTVSPAPVTSRVATTLHRSIKLALPPDCSSLQATSKRVRTKIDAIRFIFPIYDYNFKDLSP